MGQDADDTETVTDPQLTSSVTPGEPEVLDAARLMGGPPAMPAVQPHAVDAARARAAEAQAATAGDAQPNGGARPVKGRTDDRGRPFDPAVHCVDAAGKPAINSKGYLKCKRGGAAQAAARSATPSASTAADPGAAADAARRKTEAAAALDAKYASTGAASAALIITAGCIFGGDEFKPENGEQEGLTVAFTEYYRARGIIDLPPEVMLGIALTGYIAPRWNKPVFRERRTTWWKGVKAWFRKGPAVPVVPGEAGHGRDTGVKDAVRA